MHRPFDGAFPAHDTAEAALEQCHQVFFLLLDHPESPARDRAYTMLRLAQAGLHTFDHEAGRELYDAMHAAGMDDDAKRTVVLKLHDHPHVQQLLLQRCGISPRWLDGKRARPLLFDVRRDCYRQAFQPVAGGGLLVISSDRLIASAMTVWVFWGCIPHYLLGLVISAGFRTGVGL